MARKSRLVLMLIARNIFKTTFLCVSVHCDNTQTQTRTPKTIFPAKTISTTLFNPSDHLTNQHLDYSKMFPLYGLQFIVVYLCDFVVLVLILLFIWPHIKHNEYIRSIDTHYDGRRTSTDSGVIINILTTS